MSMHDCFMFIWAKLDSCQSSIQCFLFMQFYSTLSYNHCVHHHYVFLFPSRALLPTWSTWFPTNSLHFLFLPICPLSHPLCMHLVLLAHLQGLRYFLNLLTFSVPLPWCVSTSLPTHGVALLGYISPILALTTLVVYTIM